jgi:hypothetical protein
MTASPPTETMIVSPLSDPITATGKIHHKATATAIRKVRPGNVAPGWENVAPHSEEAREGARAIVAGVARHNSVTRRAAWAPAVRG